MLPRIHICRYIFGKSKRQLSGTQSRIWTHWDIGQGGIKPAPRFKDFSVGGQYKKGTCTRVLISPGTRPNISESHSEISTRVPLLYYHTHGKMPMILGSMETHSMYPAHFSTSCASCSAVDTLALLVANLGCFKTTRGGLVFVNQ